MDKFKQEEFRKDLPIIPSISSSYTFQGQKIKYLNIPCSFDTETTSIYTNEGHEKMAFVYIWQFGYFWQGNHHVYYGRSMDEFLTLLETLQERYNLNGNKRLIIYVHNFAFDFQFIRKYIEWLDVFSTKERVPIKALSVYGIEFRDSYILSAMSLGRVGNNLQKYKVQKLIGDLDYNKIRTFETQLTEKELAYCENDIKVLNAYIQEQIEQYGKITKIPFTNTGRVRSFMRDKCFHTNKNHKRDSLGHYKSYKNMISKLKLDANVYFHLHQAFSGGFTHANYNYVNQLLKDVHSIDFTSSYPYVMLSEKFPMSKPKKESNIDYEEFGKLLKSEKGLIFTAVFHNIQCVNNNEMYISEFKAMKIKGEICNNGRIQFAEYLAIDVTNIDFQIINKVYRWDKVDIANVYSFEMDYLPKPIIEGILELYAKKTTLKGVKGQEVEYLVSKGMLNSVYGMCVTNIVRDEINYSGGWTIKRITSKEEIEEQIQTDNDKNKRFLYYPWGVWVTAYARRNLWKGILSIGDDYVYSDTDSIKFLNYEKHKDFIEKYNKNCEVKLKAMCDYYCIDYNLCKPKTIKGTIKLLGVWDYEGKSDYFKTLGAKRYMTYSKESGYKLTCAGLSKQSGMEYLQKNRTVKEVFEAFSNHLKIPAENTGKMTHTYIDEEMESKVTDYQGHTSIIKSLSGVHLEPCEFTLEQSERYLEFLKLAVDGFISYESQV